MIKMSILLLVLLLVLASLLLSYFLDKGEKKNYVESETFMSMFNGSNEVPPVNTFANGVASYTLFKDKRELRYNIKFEGLSTPFKSAHFHLGRVGVSGPVVKTITDKFVPHNDNLTAGTIEGIWTFNDKEPLDDKAMTDLLSKKLYVNIHSQRFPDGEIRGQVL